MLANKQTNKPESTESKKDIEAKHTEKWKKIKFNSLKIVLR